MTDTTTEPDWPPYPDLPLPPGTVLSFPDDDNGRNNGWCWRESADPDVDGVAGWYRFFDVRKWVGPLGCDTKVEGEQRGDGLVTYWVSSYAGGAPDEMTASEARAFAAALLETAAAVLRDADLLEQIEESRPES